MGTNKQLFETLCEAGIDYNQALLFASGLKPPFSFGRTLPYKSLPDGATAWQTDIDYGVLTPCTKEDTSPGCIIVEYLDYEGTRFYLNLVEDGEFLQNIVDHGSWEKVIQSAHKTVTEYLTEQFIKNTADTEIGVASATLLALLGELGLTQSTALAYHVVDFERDNPDILSDYTALFQEVLKKDVDVGREFYDKIVQIEVEKHDSLA